MNVLTPPNLKQPEKYLTGRKYPQVIKYMGSKAKIIDFVIDGINEAYNGGPVCDLFAGACSLSGALGNAADIVTNDIQHYSSVIAHVYLHRLSDQAAAISGEDICERARNLTTVKLKRLPKTLNYPRATSLSEFNDIERLSRTLIDHEFDDTHHLFLKYYSGTWWSVEQCAWIDAIRQVADQLLDAGEIETGDHAIILTAVMHAMAYCGQGTGHYAQYRDAKTQSSMEDINIYRQKSVSDYFVRKFEALKAWNRENVSTEHSHRFVADDFVTCLSSLPPSTIYADPPYAFVHYSRFYHAIETFTLYDYPELQIKGGALVKGRYREDRHQSPFSIRSQVASAFGQMFDGVTESGSNLVLSYSNTALFELPDMIELAHTSLGSKYTVDALSLDHQHMTMGRRADRMREVEEALVVIKKK